jgi:ribonuclease HI
MRACRLDFQCTNNVVEYETLIQGLKKSIHLNENQLKITGDYEIVVK